MKFSNKLIEYVENCYDNDLKLYCPNDFSIIQIEYEKQKQNQYQLQSAILYEIPYNKFQDGSNLSYYYLSQIIDYLKKDNKNNRLIVVSGITLLIFGSSRQQIESHIMQSETLNYRVGYFETARTISIKFIDYQQYDNGVICHFNIVGTLLSNIRLYKQIEDKVTQEQSLQTQYLEKLYQILKQYIVELCYANINDNQMILKNCLQYYQYVPTSKEENVFHRLYKRDNELLAILTRDQIASGLTISNFTDIFVDPCLNPQPPKEHTFLLFLTQQDSNDFRTYEDYLRYNTSTTFSKGLMFHKIEQSDPQIKQLYEDIDANTIINKHGFKVKYTQTEPYIRFSDHYQQYQKQHMTSVVNKQRNQIKYIDQYKFTCFYGQIFKSCSQKFPRKLIQTKSICIQKFHQHVPTSESEYYFFTPKIKDMSRFLGRMTVHQIQTYVKQLLVLLEFDLQTSKEVICTCRINDNKHIHHYHIYEIDHEPMNLLQELEHQLGYIIEGDNIKMIFSTLIDQQ